MIRLVVVLVLLVPLSHAHAMGADVSYSLLAWSPDGKAALLVRDSNSDNEYLSTEYEVIDVDRTEATTVMLTSTHRARHRHARACMRSRERSRRTSSTGRSTSDYGQ